MRRGEGVWRTGLQAMVAKQAPITHVHQSFMKFSLANSEQ